MKALKDRKWICRMFAQSSNGIWTTSEEKFSEQWKAKRCGVEFIHHFDSRTEKIRDYEIFSEGEF